MSNAKRAMWRTALAAATLGTVATSQTAASEQQNVTDLPTHRIFVHGIARLPKPEETVNADSIDWSPVNNRFLVGKLGLNRFYTVYTMTPEGYLPTPRLNNMPNSARAHSGGASWHPEAEHFVFVSQKPFIQHHSHAMPEIGWHCDVWMANAEGTSFWQLTNETSLRSAPRGATNPQFSSDGTRLVWSGNTGNTNRSPWFERALYVGDFAFRDGKPELANVRAFQPGENRDFYEAYGFSPDDNRVLFAANAVSGTPWYDLDICVFDRRDQAMRNLTNSPRVWDRYATYSPDGKKIVWTSSRGMSMSTLGHRAEGWKRYMRSELWIMDADGRQPKQLTFFNRKGHPHFEERRVFVGDCAFGPDGKHLAVILYKEKQNFEPESEIIMLTLGDGMPTTVTRDTAKIEETKRPEPPKAPLPKAPEETEDPAMKKPGTIKW